MKTVYDLTAKDKRGNEAGLADREGKAITRFVPAADMMEARKAVKAAL